MIKTTRSPYAEFMFRANVTQRDIAERLGYSYQAVNSWFTGKVVPKLTLEQWHDLADLLGTTIDKLPRSFAPQSIQHLDETDQP